MRRRVAEHDHDGPHDRHRHGGRLFRSAQPSRVVVAVAVGRSPMRAVRPCASGTTASVPRSCVRDRRRRHFRQPGLGSTRCSAPTAPGFVPRDAARRRSDLSLRANWGIPVRVHIRIREWSGRRGRRRRRTDDGHRWSCQRRCSRPPRARNGGRCCGRSGPRIFVEHHRSEQSARALEGDRVS